MRGAFGVRRDGGARILGFQLDQFCFRKRLMNDAYARPEQHVPPCLARKIAAKMLVGAKNDLLVLRQAGKDRFCRRTGDDDVAERLHFGGAVDVGQRDMIGVRLAEGLELVWRAGIFQAASGIEVRKDNDLFRREDFCGVGHEFDTAKWNHVRVGRLCLAREFERIANEIGNVLQFWPLIIMGEDDGVALLAQTIDFLAQIGAAQCS